MNYMSRLMMVFRTAYRRAVRAISHHLSYFLMVLVLLGVTGCVSAGSKFPIPTADMIHTGATTKAELLTHFGPPTHTGIENGNETLTWIRVEVWANPLPFGRPGHTERVLHVMLDKGGLVKEYKYTSSVPGEGRGQTK